MAATAEKLKPDPVIRRFQMPDLKDHGSWITERLIALWPHHNEHTLFGFLRGVLSSNEFLFLYQDHAVALATVAHPHPLQPKPFVQEIFVLAEEGYQAEAASMYTEFARWAKLRGIDTIVVQEMSDVPADLIKDRLGRIFTRQQQFVRI